MSKTNVILIAESNYFYIKEKKIKNVFDKGDVYYFAFSFLPIVRADQKDEDCILEKNKTFKEILELYKSSQDSFIVLSYDYDVNGELMSAQFKKCLKKNGVPEEDIIRMPLIYDEFVFYEEEIPDLKEYEEYKKLNLEFINYQKSVENFEDSSYPKNIGFSKIRMLKFADFFKREKGEDIIYIDKIKSINSEGNNFATSIFKFIKNEK